MDRTGQAMYGGIQNLQAFRTDSNPLPNLKHTVSRNTDGGSPHSVTGQVNIRKLESLAEDSERELLRIKGVFPFTLFPDEIIIDETKVSVHTWLFFFSRIIRTVQYRDIFNVVVSHGLIFASIDIIDRNYEQQPIQATQFLKADAIRVQRIIQGIMIARKEGVDLHAIDDTKTLLKKVEEIGTT